MVRKTPIRSSQKKWVDWYKAYGDQINSKRSLSDEEKRAYIAGLVERIDVRYDKGIDEHELTLRFVLPVVSDTLKWKDRRKRSLGYELLSGGKELPLRIPNKRLQSKGKTIAP